MCNRFFFCCHIVNSSVPIVYIHIFLCITFSARSLFACCCHFMFKLLIIFFSFLHFRTKINPKILYIKRNSIRITVHLFIFLVFHAMFIHCVWICVWISVNINNICDFYFQVVPQLHQPTMLIYWLLICSQRWYNNMKISLRLMRQKLSLKNSNRTNPMKFCLRLM